MLWRAAACSPHTTEDTRIVVNCTALWLVQSRYTIEESFRTTTEEGHFLTVFKNSLSTVSNVRFKVITLE